MMPPVDGAQTEWLVELLLPRGVGNLLWMKDHLKGRLVDPIRGGETRIAGYMRSASAAEAARAFLLECESGIGVATVRRAYEVCARRALPS